MPKSTACTGIHLTSMGNAKIADHKMMHAKILI